MYNFNECNTDPNSLNMSVKSPYGEFLKLRFFEELHAD
eukprot:UN13874